MGNQILPNGETNKQSFSHPDTMCRPTAHVDGLVQERCNSSALAMALHLSCTYPSMLAVVFKTVC